MRGGQYYFIMIVNCNVNFSSRTTASCPLTLQGIAKHRVGVGGRGVGSGGCNLRGQGNGKMVSPTFLFLPVQFVLQWELVLN